MKERKLAQVMAKMNPERARAVTIELMQLGQLPDPAVGRADRTNKFDI